METLSILSAFIAGLLSFFSPCILPLIPGFLSLISGASLADIKQGKTNILPKAIIFVLGFSLAFILLGATATSLGKLLLNHLYTVNRVAGIFFVLFGLQLSGLIDLSFLNKEKRFHLNLPKLSGGLIFAAGFAFGLGWSPCIGPLLAYMLMLAANQESLGQGIILLTVYSAGIAVPFLLTALAAEKVLGAFDQVKKHFRWLELLASILLIGIGIILLWKGQL